MLICYVFINIFNGLAVFLVGLKNVAKMLECALIMSDFLGLLSLFENVGHRIYSMREVSFAPHTRLGYADVIFHCDAVFNPFFILITGWQVMVTLMQIFIFAYAAEHPQWLMGTTSGSPNMEADSDWYPFGWPPTLEERCETYEYTVNFGGHFKLYCSFHYYNFIEILK